MDNNHNPNGEPRNRSSIKTEFLELGQTNPAFEKSPGDDITFKKHKDQNTIKDESTAENGGDIIISSENEPEEERAQWNNPIEFLLSCIAMSVGIGNFYRFPYVAYTNGGGAFLIPYLVVLFCIGKPVYFLELAIGQFCSYGQVKCWNLSPFFKGVGYGSTLASFCVVSYYVFVTQSASRSN